YPAPQPEPLAPSTGSCLRPTILSLQPLTTDPFATSPLERSVVASWYLPYQPCSQPKLPSVVPPLRSLTIPKSNGQRELSLVRKPSKVARHSVVSRRPTPR